MDCDYILRNEIHEKFLKGLLSENEIAEYQSHLDSCESCQKALDNEQIIFEGIRFTGRQEMKLEISNQVAILREENKTTDWTLLFKVAAVIFFLVIMPGTLYFLDTDFFTTKQTTSTHKDTNKLREVRLDDNETEGAAKSVEKSQSPEPVSESSEKSDQEKSIPKSAKKEAEIPDKVKHQAAESKINTNDLNKVLGNIESTSGSGGMGAADEDKGIREPDVSQAEVESKPEKSVAPQSKKMTVEKLSRQAPTISSQRAMPVPGKPAEEKEQLLFENKLSSNQKGTTVYRLLPSEPVLMQRNYTNKLDSQALKSKPLQRLNFSSGYKQILANIEPPEGYQKDKGEAEKNQSFKVILISRKPDFIDMTWYPSFDIKAYTPEKISITQSDESNLLINFDEKFIYKVDISKDTTEAVLQK